MELLQTVAHHTQASRGLPPRDAPCSLEDPHCSTQVQNQEPFAVPEKYLAYLQHKLGDAQKPQQSGFPGFLALIFPPPTPPRFPPLPVLGGPDWP